MPDNDSLFEKALIRQLRSNPDGPQKTASGDAQQARACPDAEILAAYHERLLASAEMILWKEHIVGCGRCQEILSQLEATEDIAMAASEEEYVPAVYESASSPAEMLPPAMTTAGRVLPRAGARPSLATGSEASPMKASRRTTAYWLVPLGAIAATVMIWVGTRQPALDALKQSKVETAENRTAPPAPVTIPAETPAIVEKKALPVAKLGRESSRSLDETDALDKKKVQANEPPPPLTPYVPSAPPSAKAVGAAGAVAGGPDGKVEAPPKAVTETVEVSGAAPLVPTSDANIAPLESGQQLQSAQTRSAPAPAAAQKTAAAGTQSTGAQSPAAGTALMRLQPGVSAEQAPLNGRAISHMNVLNPRLIPAPGGNVLWRVGENGLIENSRDAGATWARQNSGVSVTLDSGAASDVAICWVIGRSGTILRTIDGGGQWARIVSPIAGDVVGISAVDALHATVWDGGRKNSFVTVDGGVSWTRVANP
ncbi:MAG TPA: hypothetical protein VKF79_05345 [Candidatus Acidoferrum sp.]|nr:hypothetical protein [Candidatus Acidoferrum sp.]